MAAPVAGTIENVGFGTPGSWEYFVALVVGLGQRHVFAHLKSGSAKVKAGDEVEEGKVLAATGDTGWGTAPP